MIAGWRNAAQAIIDLQPGTAIIRVDFMVELARTPSPMHVVGEMIRAAQAFAAETGSVLERLTDADIVADDADLLAAAQDMIDSLAALGTMPCAQSVLRLR